MRGICIISDFSKIFQFRHENFLILTGDEHSCYSEQLVLAPRHFLHITVSVDEVNCNVESFRLQLVLRVDFYQPGDKNRSHTSRQVWLIHRCAILASSQPAFRVLHVLRAVGSELGYL